MKEIIAYLVPILIGTLDVNKEFKLFFGHQMRLISEKNYAEVHDMFCPLTNNLRAEEFLDELQNIIRNESFVLNKEEGQKILTRIKWFNTLHLSKLVTLCNQLK